MAASTRPLLVPATTPAPSPATTPELTWAYPFQDKDHKEIADPQKFYQAMSYMDDGFFPLGVNGFPHGGVHFGNGSASQLDQAGGVRCIADGEIVAHKIDDAYPHLQFSDGKWAAYSTGFVLVRHRLTMPCAPNSTGPQPADEAHDIYSLYMHMADWVTYLADAKLPRPFWWDVDAYSISGKDHQNRAADGGTAGVAGAFVWTEPKAGKKRGQYNAGQQVGFLPEGCEIIVGEKRGQWGHIQTITQGGMISPTKAGEFGLDDASVPWEASYERTAGHAAITQQGNWGWVFLPGLQSTKEPKKVGQVVIPNPPIQVKAGTLLGQIGEYHDYERANHLPPAPRRSLLHLEVFADDGFSAFLTKSRQRATQLPAEQKTLLVIDAGAKLVQSIAPADRRLGEHHPVAKVSPTDDSPASGLWVKVQPTYLSQGVFYVPDGSPVWIEREKLANPINGTPAWSRFPLRLQGVADPASGFPMIYSRAQLDALDEQSKAVDDQKVNWWRVTCCTADGKNARGWVCGTGHPGTTWQSPWAWPGFEIVDATGINLADAFKRNLVVTDAADWKEKKAFEPSAATVNNSPLLLKLEQTVGKQDLGANNPNNGKVTARAIQAAMRVSALAQALSHVILRYESEWGGDMTRWNAITPIMRNAKANWLKELERVKKLQWWDSVRGKIQGFPASATVLHVHPVALVCNFIRAGSAKSISEDGIYFIFKQEALAGVTNKFHWPGGASGVTLGAGYDMKERSTESIFNDMKSIGFDDPTARAISAGAGLTGDAAMNFSRNNAHVVNLSDEKQIELLRKTVPHYEKMVVRAIKIPLRKNEFDALVSYAYNPGGGWSSVTSAITHGSVEQAMNKITQCVTSGGVVYAGLVKRRADEVTLYTTGRYEFHGEILPPRQ
jgi:GH24 family phage-related lysozyme (muramidase)